MNGHPRGDREYRRCWLPQKPSVRRTRQLRSAPRRIDHIVRRVLQIGGDQQQSVQFVPGIEPIKRRYDAIDILHKKIGIGRVIPVVDRAREPEAKDDGLRRPFPTVLCSISRRKRRLRDSQYTMFPNCVGPCPVLVETIARICVRKRLLGCNVRCNRTVVPARLVATEFEGTTEAQQFENVA